MSRRLTPEILDTLSPSDPAALASRADLQRLHPLLGQTRLWLRWIRNRYPDRPPSSLADLGSGDGYLLTSILPTLFPQGGHGARIFFIDRQPTLPDSALESLRRKSWLPTVVAQDVLAWAASAPPTELIFTNLFLHHFPDSELKTLFQNLSTRTSTFAAAEPFRGFAGSLGARLLRLLGCHPVTQHDARVSVEAGFRPSELSKLWPQPHHWSLTEQRVGLFTHFFSAEKKT